MHPEVFHTPTPTVTPDPTDPRPRAAIYVRAATNGQDGYASLDRQERACQREAEAGGYRVVGVYREVASGAADADRPVMSWLLGHVADGAFDAVIIDQFDRLGRDTAQAVGLVDTLALAEVRLVIAAATEEDR